jgi:Lipid-A-disaccharide synthetase
MKNTIFLVAGCPSTDLHGAHFIRRLKASHPNYRFIGIGGPEMQKEGLESVGINASSFPYKPFFPFKNFHWIFSEAYTHPVHAITHIRNYLVLRKLKIDDIL